MQNQMLDQAQRGRDNNFDFLRFCLALMVIFSHSYLLIWGSDIESHVSYSIRRSLTGGLVTVNGFFIISGFLVTQSWERSRDWRDYLKKRCLRIFPGYLGALLFCLFVVAPLSLQSLQIPLPSLSDVTFAALHFSIPDIPGVFAHNPHPHQINGSLWSIQYEFICYLALGLLGCAGALRRRGLILALFGIAFLAQCYIIAFHVPLSHTDVFFLGPLQSWPRFAACFLAGCVSWLYRDKIPLSRNLFLSALLLFLASCLRSNVGACLMPVLGGYLLLYLAFSPQIRLHRFASRGDLSYGIYLYAFPVQQLLTQYFGSHLTPIALFFAAVPITLLCAWVSWHGIEKPLLRLKYPQQAPVGEAARPESVSIS